jgi:hypothetical protein
MVGEVVGNRACRQISARYALAVEEHVLGLESARQIALADDPGHHVLVKGAGAAVRFLNSIAAIVVCIRESRRAGDAVFRVVGVIVAGGQPCS